MATRIAHISDLHFPAKVPEQVTALRHSILAVKADVLVVTGDLTQSGQKSEFHAARSFIESVRLPTLVVPGNHDVPVPGVLARLHRPFARFEAYFPEAPAYMATPDVVIVGLNTAVGWQPGLDWSLGRVLPSRLQRTLALLSAHRADRLAIVAAHHPLHRHPLDPKRSRTFAGLRAFEALAGAGMRLLIHGHLHRTDCRPFPSHAHEIYEISANTALANRERAGAAAYNILDVEHGRWKLCTLGWTGEGYDKAGFAS